SWTGRNSRPLSGWTSIDHPDLDSEPSKATVSGTLLTQTGELNGSFSSYGDSAEKPEHWSSLNLIDRAKKLDKDVEYPVIKDYDQRNFYVHTGLAGVFNLSKENFEALCAFAL